MIQYVESPFDHLAVVFEKEAAKEEYESVSHTYVLQKIVE